MNADTLEASATEGNVLFTAVKIREAESHSVLLSVMLLTLRKEESY